jgi:hypothetical protein
LLTRSVTSWLAHFTQFLLQLVRILVPYPPRFSGPLTLSGRSPRNRTHTIRSAFECLAARFIKSLQIVEDSHGCRRALRPVL